MSAIKYKLFILVVLLTANNCIAQSDAGVVGEKLPHQLGRVLDAHFIDEKPTIINFWATWCIPCINELKLLDSILRETDQINVLSVTYESDEIVSSFLERNKRLDAGNLVFITSDSLFSKHFPHQMIPHNIWLDGEGVIRHITGGEDLNRKNISMFMENRELDVGKKIDVVNFDPFEPFHLSDSEFEYRSILTKRIDGIFSGKSLQPVGFADKKQYLRAFAFNTTLHNMLWLAVNEGKSPSNFFNTMRIETSDSLRFFTPSQAPESFDKSNYKTRDDWRSENTHCYELRFREPISDSLFFASMLNDLQRNFKFDVQTVEDSILCSIIDLSDHQSSQPNPSDSTYLLLNEEGLIAQNVSLLSLFEHINERVKIKPSDPPSDPPFVDRTGGFRVSIQLNFENGIPSYEKLKRTIEHRLGVKIHQKLEKYRITIIKDMS